MEIINETKEFETRKAQHIELSLDAKSQADGYSGTDLITLYHDALPEIDFSEVDISTKIFNKDLKTPFFIAGMTAGHEHAYELNLRLAKVAQKRGWAMGVGSQRRQVESFSSKSSLEIDQWKKLREICSELILFSNIGITQLITLSNEQLKKLTDSISAQALVVHLNPHQEVLQKEGTPYFRGAVSRLEKLVQEFHLPIILKETGSGFSEKTLNKIKNIPFSVVDVSGLGGTHWGRIEGQRGGSESLYYKASQTFSHWGVSTVESVLNSKKILSSQKIWASGGVRTGLDAAKLLAIGAERVGFAQPALQAALISEEALDQWMNQIEFELKTALFCTGSQTMEQLKNGQGIWTLRTNY